MNTDSFTKEQVDTLYNILTAALRSDVNLLNIEMLSDVVGVITLSIITEDDIRVNFDIIDTGDAVCYIFSLAEKNNRSVQYINNTNDYNKFFAKFVAENPNAQRP